ncbi:MAG: hypothetical protein ACYSWQ_02465 [Planctomycetota bacterium]|jgi:hypothetical protein
MNTKSGNLSTLLPLVCFAASSGGYAYGAAVPGGTLDPTSIPKYESPLIIPPAMPQTSEITGNDGESIDYHEIAVRQFDQDLLPPSMDLPTTVWSYGSLFYPDNRAFFEGLEPDQLQIPFIPDPAHEGPSDVSSIWYCHIVEHEDNEMMPPYRVKPAP